MENAIIIVILVIVIIVAVKGSMKHLLGQGGCCGGSAPVKTKKKKLNGPVIQEKIIHIEGMHCDHCRRTVEAKLNALDGVAGSVNLKKNTALVKAIRQMEDGELVEAVEEAGFSVIGIKNVR